MVQVGQDRAGDAAGNVLARQATRWTAVGCETVVDPTIQCGVGVGVPVLVEHVVAHDEADRALGHFVIDQDALLVVGGGAGQRAKRR